MKIICDWDETIQPVGSLVWNLIAKEKNWEGGNMEFGEEWFKYFWNNSGIKFEGRGGESIETGGSFFKALKDKSR